MPNDKLFRTMKKNELFAWKDIQTEELRKSYGDLLYLIWAQEIDEITQTDNAEKHNYYNYNYCLSLHDQGFDIDFDLLYTLLDKYVVGSQPLSLSVLNNATLEDKIKSLLKLVYTEGQYSTEHKNKRIITYDDYIQSAATNITKSIAHGYTKLIKQGTSLDFEFLYQRQRSSTGEAPLIFDIETYNREPKGGENWNQVPSSKGIFGLTVGSVLWLYYYERMGIFKILGALMDDYNYRGKFPISGNGGGQVKSSAYQPLLDTICSLYRLGIGSNLRDRICLYQRVLGVTIDHKLDIQVERNEPFMKLFNKLINYMLEFYKAKQLAQAIQSAGGGQITNDVRTSVKTQTSIRDTMLVLQQQFEKMEYGRNQINTFLGIAMVYATISLIKLVKSEIGVPAQYDNPEEYIPAAYDILVLKRAPTFSENNRFTIFDNCASYGYRLLTDIQLANMQNFRASGTQSSMDFWLNDIEGWVEGYNNAYQSIPESVEAIL